MKQFLLGLLVVFSVVSCCCAPVATTAVPLTVDAQTRLLESDIRAGNLPSVAEKTDHALSAVISFSVWKLRQRGYDDEADQIEMDYTLKFQGFLAKMVAPGIKDIGDHKPLVQWLAQVTATLYATLGFATCKRLHITDIDVINFGIPVVFHPCDFPMDGVTTTREGEYFYHFAHSPKYGAAFLPVVSYWVTQITCTVAAWGTTFVCMPISTGVEFAVDTFVAPKLSNFIFERSCP